MQNQNQNLKKCNSCSSNQLVTEFYSDGLVRKKTGQPGLRAICKTCLNSVKHSKEVAQRASKKWREAHKGYDCARVALRRARKKQATPPYIKPEELRQVYLKAQELGQTVDHIIPLTHPLVCGLHVPWNLQLLSKSENSSKHNKFSI